MKDTGGSAFPLPVCAGDVAYEGISIRDYFAAKALHIASFHTDYEFYNSNQDLEGYYKEVSDKAYAQADAMLKVRNE